MNKFDLILKKFAEAIAQGGDRDDVEAQVLAFAKRQGYGDFNSIEELERAGITAKNFNLSKCLNFLY